MINLEKPIGRLVDIDGTEVAVTMSPDNGGELTFREKGKRGEKNTSSIPIKEVMSRAVGSAGLFDGPPPPKAKGSSDPDLVDLASLEARVMIAGGEDLPAQYKGVFFAIVRELRDERREDMKLPAVK